MGRTIILLATVFFSVGLTNIIRAQGTIAKDKLTETLWKGFKRYNFRLAQRDVRLIVPHKALAGKPWIWRARFPDWHTEADSILISEGFHLVHVNSNHEYSYDQPGQRSNRKNRQR